MPDAVVTRSRRRPGAAAGSIATSTNRYEPAALTRTRPTVSPSPTASTRAPCRPVPWIRMRTGFHV